MPENHLESRPWRRRTSIFSSIIRGRSKRAVEAPQLLGPEAVDRAVGRRRTGGRGIAHSNHSRHRSAARQMPVDSGHSSRRSRWPARRLHPLALAVTLLAPLLVALPSVPGRRGRRGARRGPLPRAALAAHRAVPRRPDEGRDRRAGQARPLLHRRRQRRRLEDDRLRPHLAADLRRPADRLDRRASPSRPSNPDVIYVGSGEGMQRPDLSTGDGIYKSTDAGKTWTHLGLRDGQQIPQIVVDPQDANRLFVAVLGHPYGPNAERGVFRSTDGGETFEKVLYKDEDTGAVDVALDPREPATSSTRCSGRRGRGRGRTATFSGPGSGLFKSTDGGTTWRPLTDGPARPSPRASGASASRSRRATRGGSTPPSRRADKAGHLPLRRRRRELDARQRGPARGRPRPSDVAEVRVDPTNPDIVYVADDRRRGSPPTAGRRSPRFRGAPGGDDYQRIWINPDDPDDHPARRRPGRDRHGQRRRDVEQLVQPADRAVLPREHRQRVPVPRVRRAAGERLGLRREPRRRRPDHVPRLAPGGRRGVRLRRARSARPRHRLRRQGDALRPAHRPGAERVAAARCAARATASCARSRCCSRRSTRKTLYFASNVLWKTTNGGQQLGRDQPGPDARRAGRCRRTSASYRDTPEAAADAARRHLHASRPSPLDAQTDLGRHRRRPRST